MNADDLARRIVVRHREGGYLRLELPPEICHAAAAAVIEPRCGKWAVSIASTLRRRNAAWR